jgi:hypothetical protein
VIEGICKNLYMGISFLWLSQQSSSVFLLISIITGSLCHLYYTNNDINRLVQGNRIDKKDEHVDDTDSDDDEYWYLFIYLILTI